MIRKYERTLNSSDKQIIENLMSRSKSESFKTSVFVIILIFAIIFSWFLLWLTGVNYLPVTIVIIIASLLISYQVYFEILELIRLPKILNESKEIVKNGKARVTEIHIDRYLEIKNNENRLDYFLVEHKGTLKLIKPSIVLRADRLSTLTEKIDILDINNESVFHTEINYLGNNLEPYLVIKKEISKKILASDLWRNLINNKPVIGNLKEFEVIIGKTNTFKELS